jgi:hypothetical protein
MNIHQLTVHYDPSEDRLLLRIGTTDQTEIQVWLTRRMTLQLATALPKVLANPITLSKTGHAGTGVEESQTPPTSPPSKPTAWLNPSDLSGTYRPPLKILNGGVPLLVTEVDFNSEKDGQTMLVLKEKRADRGTERTLELRLEPQLLQGLHHLISESLPRTDWTLGKHLDGSTPLLALNQVPPKHLLN